MLMGTGGAPEGVIAAAALKCLGGEIQAILQFRSEEEIARAKEMGVEDINRVYKHDDLAEEKLCLLLLELLMVVI